MGFPWIHRPVGGRKEVTNAPPIYSKDGTPAAFIAGEFIRWLSEQDTGWFAHPSFISPHPPFVVPAPYNGMYDPADGPDFRRAATRVAERRIHPGIGLDFETQRKQKFVVGQEGYVADWDEAAFRQIRALYYGMISEVDAQLGRVFSNVRERGDWDDTVVILTSDHAEIMGDHFMLGKGGFFDGSYHIPLIIRDPLRKETSGSKVDVFTEAVDIAPTVLDLLGSNIPAHLDGRSLAPFLSGENPTDWRDVAHWEFDFRSISARTAERHFGISSRQCNLAVVRTERFKYVHFGGGLPPVLFDLANDPAETVNLAEDSGCQSVRIEMAERLLSWRAEHLDQSLALSELTEDGVVGEFHTLP
jgi:arylsulfatase A-like enzyme